LKLFLGFFFLQIGALVDVAEQNPVQKVVIIYNTRLSVLLLIVF
jgi:hypothetical protein